MEITLKRTGLAPLVLESAGELYSATTQSPEHDQGRWHELTIYDASARLVALVKYMSVYPLEQPGHHQVLEGANARELCAQLVGYDPTAYLIGKPERTAAEREKNATVNLAKRRMVRNRWDELLSRLLTEWEVEVERPAVLVELSREELLRLDILRGAEPRSDFLRRLLSGSQ